MENYNESKQIFIRELREEDYSIYREVTYSHFFYKNVFTEKFMQGAWERVNAENIFCCAIIEKSTEDICGFCEIKDIDTFTPEIGIDIRDGYMGRGYAQEAIKQLISYASEKFKINYFIWKADKNNSISRHIAEKLGGKLILEEATMKQWIIDYGKEKGLLKEEDIQYVCTYKIEITVKDIYVTDNE